MGKFPLTSTLCVILVASLILAKAKKRYRRLYFSDKYRLVSNELHNFLICYVLYVYVIVCKFKM